MDDPWEAIYVQGFPFHGGTHLFIPSTPDSLFSLQCLARTFVRDSNDLGEAFSQQSVRTIQAIAALSDATIVRARLHRNTPAPSPSTQLTVPADSALRQLKFATKWPLADVADLFARAGASIQLLDDLAAPTGVRQSTSSPVPKDALSWTPLVRSQSHISIIAPQLLAQALIIESAIQKGAQYPLAQLFHLNVFNKITSTLRVLGLQRLSPRLKDLTHAGHSKLSHELWRFDRDKILHVVLATDALGCSAENSSRGSWPTYEIASAVARARRQVEATLFADPTMECNELQTLITFAGFGRSASDLAVDDSRDPAIIIFSAADLESIAFGESEDRDSLLLWKFAINQAEAAQTTRIQYWNLLDLYAWWRAKGRRIIPPDAGRIDFMSLAPNMAQSLRQQAIIEPDWHTIASPRPGHVIEVGRGDIPEAPIYAPRELGTSWLGLAVALEHTIVWACTLHNLSQATPEERVRYLEHIRMIAFWIWQFGRLLTDKFQPHPNHEVFRIDVDLGAANDWTRVPLHTPAPLDGGYSIRTAGKNRVLVKIQPDFMASYSNEDNRAERRFASHIVCCLLELAGLSSAAAQAAVDSIIDEAAPIGPKRMMHKIDLSQQPEYIGQVARKARYVQDFDIARVTAATAQYFRNRKALAERSHDQDEIQSLINGAVGDHYRSLRSLARQCSSAQAIPVLLELNEALVAHEAQQRFTLASQLACYADSAPSVDRLKREGKQATRAAIATRFLLEYFAAQPSRGIRPFSNTYFDELLAIAAEIYSLGVVSDICKYQIAKVELVVAPHGYDLIAGTYDHAADVISNTFAQQLLNAARSRSPAPSRPTMKHSDAESLDSACAAEFSATMTEIITFFGEATAVAAEAGAAVVVLPADSFEAKLQQNLNWTSQKIRMVLEQFSLTRREDFLEPPPPFSRADVFPWKFNRALSYLRRPFVRFAGTSGDQIAFSPGFLSTASRNLVQLCLQGRLKAVTPAMRKFMSYFVSKESEAFNAEVQQVAEARGFLARSRVNKIGRARIADGGRDLGDIDVLMVDRYRKRVWLLECKDFSIARTPVEIRADLDELFVGTKDKTSAQVRHSKRVDWVKLHLEQILEWLALPPGAGKWQVLGAFVFSQRLISPLLAQSSFPIWTMEEIRERKVP